MTTESSNRVPVLLYDGECGLCNRCVLLLLRLDRRGRLRFAPLQGGVAQEYLEARGFPTENFSSIVFVRDWSRRMEEVPLFKTDGVLAALREAGGVGRVLAWLRIFPRTWRDAAYRVIARWRYRIFGHHVPGPLPRPEWEDRIWR